MPTAALLLATLLASALVSAGPSQAAAPSEAAAEERLAKELRGRVAGEPVECLYLRDIQSSRIIPGAAIVYETGGNLIYVNRPRAGRSSLKSWNILVSQANAGQLCSRDPIRLHDRSRGMQTGFVTLGEFVPYRREADAAR